MSSKGIAVAGLSALAIAASGCSGDSNPEAEFRAAFEEKYGESAWYQHITGMEMTDSDALEPGRLHIEVTTDDAEGGVPCGTVRDFAVDSGVYDEIPSVEVIGSDGVTLGGCA